MSIIQLPPLAPCRICGKKVPRPAPIAGIPFPDRIIVCDDCERRANQRAILEQARRDAEAASAQKNLLDNPEFQQALGIPPGYAAAKPSDYVPAISDALREIASGAITLAAFSGGRGTGKTHAAFAVARTMLRALRADHFVDICRKEASPPYCFHHVPALLAQLRQSRHADSRIDRLCRTKRLVILDDIGSHNFTDWGTEAILRIIYEREQWRRPTLVICDVPFPELAKHKGWDRIVSRMASGRVIQFTGGDRRIAA